MEVDSLRRLLIGHLTSIRGEDDAVTQREALDGRAKLGSGRFQQQLSNLGRRVIDRRATIGHGMAAGGVSLVRSQRRVGRDELELLQGHGQLVGGDLPKRSAYAGAEFHLAAAHRYALCVDLDPRIEHGIDLEVAGKIGGENGGSQRVLLTGKRTPGTEQRKAHHDPAAGKEPATALADRGVCLVHTRSLASPALRSFPRAATSRIAARMRMCVPHRHRLGAICSRICCSVGWATCSSNACARMIMPAMQ